jgi:hypothetical protein
MPLFTELHELEFVDLTKVKKEQMARFHEDILAHAGKLAD